jgi:hypothetical protein
MTAEATITTSFDAIVLDTTVLWQDLLAEGVHFTVLLSSLKESTTTLALPRVVLDEAARHYSQRRDKAIAKLDEACHELSRLGERIREPSVDRTLGGPAYPLASAKRWALPVTILPYPKAPHEQVAARDLSRRRPFQDSGKGYRDTLTWLSILDLLPTKPRVAFVSSNTDDFAAPKATGLHPDLVQDVPQGSEVRLFTSLEQFNAECIIPHLRTDERLRFDLETDALDDFRLRDWLRKELHFFVRPQELRGVLYPSDGNEWSVRTFRFEDMKAPRVTSASYLREQEYLIQLTVVVVVAMHMRHPRATTDYQAKPFRYERGTVTVSLEGILDLERKKMINCSTLSLRGAAGMAMSSRFMPRDWEDSPNVRHEPEPELRVFESWFSDDD